MDDGGPKEERTGRGMEFTRGRTTQRADTAIRLNPKNRKKGRLLVKEAGTQERRETVSLLSGN